MFIKHSPSEIISLNFEKKTVNLNCNFPWFAWFEAKVKHTFLLTKTKLTCMSEPFQEEQAPVKTLTQATHWFQTYLKCWWNSKKFES